MRRNQPSKKANKVKPVSRLTVWLDDQSKRCVARAAQLRGISMSDYVRTVAVPQARRELHAARRRVIILTAEEQLAFWRSLNAPVKLTAAQRRLGSLMRGEP